MRRKRDERRLPDDREDVPAEEWLKEFRPVRPDALTSADRDARGANQPGFEGSIRGQASGRGLRRSPAAPTPSQPAQSGQAQSQPAQAQQAQAQQVPSADGYRGYARDGSARADPSGPVRAGGEFGFRDQEQERGGYRSGPPDSYGSPRDYRDPRGPDHVGADNRARGGYELRRDEARRDLAGDTAARDGDRLASDQQWHDNRRAGDGYREPGGYGYGDAAPRDAGLRYDDGRSRDARPGDVRPGDARQGDARPGDARPRDGRPGEERPGDGRPGKVSGLRRDDPRLGGQDFPPGDRNQARDNYRGGSPGDGYGLGDNYRPALSGYRGPEGNSRGPEGYARGPEGNSRGPEGYSLGPQGYARGEDRLRPGSAEPPRSPNFAPGPEDGARGPLGYWRGPDGYPRRPENLPLGPENLPRGSDDYPRYGPPARTERRQAPSGQTEPRPRGDQRHLPPAPAERPEDRRAATARDGNGHVPSPIERLVQATAQQQGQRNEDDEMTRPLPVILPGASSVPRPGHIEAPRGPFEAARPSQPPADEPPADEPPARPVSVTGSVPPPPVTFSARHPDLLPAPVPPASTQPPVQREIPQAAAARLDQIKDLHLTAEAIGDDALDRHFDQVSQRQRDLIREFFDKAGPAAGSANG